MTSILSTAAKLAVLGAQRLQRWHRRFEAESDAAASERRDARPTFVEVPRGESSVLELVLLSGRVLRVRESIEPELRAHAEDASLNKLLPSTETTRPERTSSSIPNVSDAGEVSKARSSAAPLSSANVCSRQASNPSEHPLP